MDVGRPLLSAILLAAILSACGGDDSGDGPEVDAGAAADEFVARIQALPHVISVVEMPTQQVGYRYFYIGFDQPVDHADEAGQHFTQFLTLIHRDEHAPLVLASTGYSNYYNDQPTEPTELLAANQIVIEHR